MEISIIVPTFRPGGYLFECLKSVIDQDFRKDKYEVVIVLNGEKEPYFSDISSFVKDSQTKFRIIHTSFAGVSNARNIALDELVTDYVVFLDDDDVLSPNYLSSLYSKISDESIVVSDVKTFIENIDDSGDDYISKHYSKCSGTEPFNLVGYRGFLSSACAKMIPKSIIGDFRFEKNLKFGEDAVFMFAISCKIRNIILADKNAIYYRRLRPGSATRTRNPIVFRFKISLHKILMFTQIYFGSMRSYSFKLYLTRVAATLKSI